MDLELLKKELTLFMKWIDRSSHEITNEDWMNEQNVESYMDSLEFKTRVWAMPSDESSGLHKHGVTNCVALPEWLSKERCAVAAGIWNSHQEGDNKRVQAIKQIKAWAADAGYEIGFKKANELFKQHCL